MNEQIKIKLEELANQCMSDESGDHSEYHRKADAIIAGLPSAHAKVSADNFFRESMMVAAGWGKRGDWDDCQYDDNCDWAKECLFDGQKWVNLNA